MDAIEVGKQQALFREVNERVWDANDAAATKRARLCFCANALGRTAPNA
jgi:hypothetical protein